MPEWTFQISPIAASRPRISKYGAYFTGPYKKFRGEAADCVYEIIGTEFPLIESPLHVDLELYITQPMNTKLGMPNADIDNFTKAIFDVMNGKLWVDDKQIQTMYVSKQWAPKGEPGYFTLGTQELS
jgi:Holliday junction resolvase RusA-like endonuclease